MEKRTMSHTDKSLDQACRNE